MAARAQIDDHDGLSGSGDAMSNTNEKKLAGEAAIRYVEDGAIVGVGTGSTVAFFIAALADLKDRIQGAVSSSEQSSAQLKKLGIPVLDLNATGPLTIYIDGADECDGHKRLIKGGGAALTREKIVAAASEKFVCIIDSSKRVDLLGRFPVPIEVIPMARSLIGREIVKLGGNPVWRDGVVTDNGNWIIDVHGWQITDPVGLEEKLNQLPGIVTVGLCARRPADVVLVGDREM
jgi:ribose 5-phosphate isomerase A